MKPSAPNVRLSLRLLGIAATMGFAALTLLAGQRPENLPTPGQTMYERTPDGEMGGGSVGLIEAPDRPPSLLSRFAPSTMLDAAPTAPPYPFFPQAGTLWQDIFVNNFIDLGDGLTPRDYDCSQYTYVGHTGHDADIVGFREQAIGVPIFAALDGTVTAAHDGELDQEVTNLVGRPANYVTVSHTGGYRTLYFHMKKGSVAVSVGQTVTAGTQLGLTGSSGNSSWPHLHFESQFNGVPFEPNTGSCRPGQSYWAKQTALRRDPYVAGFTYGTAAFSGDAGYPYDQVTRRGSYQTGTSTVYFRFSVNNLPTQSTYRVVILRPDGTTASDSSGSYGNSSRPTHLWYWFSRNVSLNTTGTWTTDVYANGTRIASAPFTVVATAAEIVNHAPLAVASVALDPPAPSSSDVPFCRVTPASLYRRDPDYDLVRYRYRWEINGTVVREVTNAGLADAIPRGLLRDGDRLTCTVTPLDESTAGPSASASNATGPAPGPPTGFTASSSGPAVTLRWVAPSGGAAPDTYIIEAGSSSGSANLASFSTGTTATTFSTSGVAAGTYYVRVRAANAAGTSAPSNEAILVVGPTACTSAPGAPTGLTTTVSGGTVTIRWMAPSGGCAPTSYILQAGAVSGWSALANSNVGNVTSFVATGVGTGFYYIRVLAANAYGQSAASNEALTTVGTPTATVDVQPRSSDFGTKGGCIASLITQVYTVTASPGVTWTVSFTGTDLDDPVFAGHRGHLDKTSGSGSGTVTFTVTIPAQTAVLGCNTPLGTFNYGDDITFVFSTGARITATLKWVFFVTGG